MVCSSLNALSNPFAFLFGFIFFGEEQLQLFFFFLSLYGNKPVEWILNIPFLCVLGLSVFWFCTVAHIVFVLERFER